MPHINEIFDGTRKDIRNRLKQHKKAFRSIVAKRAGYDMESVAIIPYPITEEDLELADNILPLEFVIDMGSRAMTEVQAVAQDIANKINKLEGMAHLEFGVWVKAHSHCHYTEPHST